MYMVPRFVSKKIYRHKKRLFFFLQLRNPVA